MQSRTTRGVRRLLVSTGVISLVLSVAAPAALAAGQGTGDGSGRQPGATGEQVELCHNGRLIAPNENSTTNGHTDERHDDGVESDCCVDMDFPGGGATGGEFPGEGEFPGQGGSADVCEAGSDDEEGRPGGNDVGGDGGENAGDNGNDGAGGNGSGGGGTGTTPDAGEPEPEVVVEAEPPAEVPAEPAPQPVIIISDDAVTRPMPAVTPAVPAAPVVLPETPAVPAAAPAVTTRAPEVLGSVTTRTPGSASAGMTSLAATGLDTTTVLALVGSGLLLAGFALQLAARRQLATASTVA